MTTNELLLVVLGDLRAQVAVVVQLLAIAGSRTLLQQMITSRCPINEAASMPVQQIGWYCGQRRCGIPVDCGNDDDDDNAQVQRDRMNYFMYVH